jgi:ABC-type transport system involved in cytochrome bd biosynthesis fused ATPase/permease subunit
MVEGEHFSQERRSGGGRRAEDRGERFRSLAAALLALCGALSVIYFLFAAVGAVDIGDAAVGSAIALVLALLWLAGAWQRSRTGGGFATRGDRERRGF